jgi:hypothetical protein
VRKVRPIIIASSLLCVLVLSGCHGTPMTRMKWVNPADADQTMEFRVPVRSVVGKLHQVFTGQRQQATYVIKKGEGILDSGTLTQESLAYVLKSKDGREQRLQVESAGSLQGEKGATWSLQNPTTTAATLREW